MQLVKLGSRFTSLRNAVLAWSQLGQEPICTIAEVGETQKNHPLCWSATVGSGTQVIFQLSVVTCYPRQKWQKHTWIRFRLNTLNTIDHVRYHHPPEKPRFPGQLPPVSVSNDLEALLTWRHRRLQWSWDGEKKGGRKSTFKKSICHEANWFSPSILLERLMDFLA